MLPILLAAQAAGMVADYYSTQQQIKMSRIGTQLEQAQIGSNLEMTRLQTEQSSLQAMEDLRSTLGSQIAIQAARGTRSGVGSAAAISSKTVSNSNADERTRRMNLLAKEAELRASSVLSGMHQLTSETQLGQSMTKRLFGNLPGSSSFDMGGSGTTAFSGSTATGSYGLTPV